MNPHPGPGDSSYYEKWSGMALERVTNRQPPEKVLATHRADTQMATHLFDAFLREFGIDETLHLDPESTVSEGQHDLRNPRSPADASQLRTNDRMAV